jgi:hypothetical protein
VKWKRKENHRLRSLGKTQKARHHPTEETARESENGEPNPFTNLKRMSRTKRLQVKRTPTSNEEGSSSEEDAKFFKDLEDYEEPSSDEEEGSSSEEDDKDDSEKEEKEREDSDSEDDGIIGQIFREIVQGTFEIREEKDLRETSIM